MVYDYHLCSIFCEELSITNSNKLINNNTFNLILLILIICHLIEKDVIS